jgi:hypothetical protein
MKLNVVFAFLALAWLAGCSVIAAIDEPAPLRPGFARIVIVRVGNAVPFVGNAQVEVNGKQVATLGARERYVGDVAEGLTVISAHGFSFVSGRFTIELPMKSGEVYRLRISNRGDTLIDSIPSGARIIEAAGAFRIGK